MHAQKRTTSQLVTQRAATTPSLPPCAGGSYAAQVRDTTSRAGSHMQRAAAPRAVRSTTSAAQLRSVEPPRPSAGGTTEATLEERSLEEDLRKLGALSASRGRRAGGCGGGAASVGAGRSPGRSWASPSPPPRQQQQQREKHGTGRSEGEGIAGHGENSQSRIAGGRAQSGSAVAAIDASKPDARTATVPHRSTTAKDVAERKPHAPAATDQHARNNKKPRSTGKDANSNVESGASKVAVGTSTPPPSKAEASTSKVSGGKTSKPAGALKPITAVW